MKERIINFLGQGLRPSQIAAIVGCTAGYVTQIAKDPDNASKISEVMQEHQATTTDDKALATKYMAVEHMLLNNIEQAAAMADMRDLTRALEVVGNRQEKRLQRLNPVQTPGTQVLINLTLPSHAAIQLPSYQLNEKKEVIAIDNKPMAPLSSEGVKNLFDQLSGKKQTAVTMDDGKTIDLDMSEL